MKLEKTPTMMPSHVLIKDNFLIMYPLSYLMALFY